ncbi:hypothetical protein RND81_06G020800 [Saponaria officinalis]|uniref:Uncharacterized protein n=1 Tax=Saponaria officinalis TaxID=3572 RepID=A0AAW1K6V0_SAPOF
MMKYSKIMKILKLNGEYFHQLTCFKNTSTYSPSPKNNLIIDKIVASNNDFIGNFISTGTREHIYVTNNNNNHQVSVEGTKLKLKGVKRPQHRTDVTPGKGGVHN